METKIILEKIQEILDQKFDQRIERLNGRTDVLEASSADLDTTVNDLAAMTARGFTSTDQRLLILEEVVAKLEDSVSSVTYKVGTLEETVILLESRASTGFTGINYRLDHPLREELNDHARRIEQLEIAAVVS